MSLIIKALIGAFMVVVIAVLAKTKNYYLAGLVPLFPTFALIANYIVGKERSVNDLRSTLVFSMFSLIPYLVYLFSLYTFVNRHSLNLSLFLAAVLWALSALILVLIWSKNQ